MNREASKETRGEMAAASPWAPLSSPVFRSLWIANQVSFVGTWIHQVGAAWLMTSLAPRPIMVALVQAATGLSMFLLVVPAGAIADIFDRRRVLIVAQGWMLTVAVVLGVMTVTRITSPWLLVLFTFLLAVGAALSAPTFQAILPELVPRQQLPAAIALNGMGVNVARAFGPAIGGVIVASLGPGAAFLLNGASFFGLILVVARWKGQPDDSDLPAERMTGAMRAGIRFVRHTPQMTSVLVRSGLFILAGSALWALLPLLARTELGLSAAGYGLILAFFGSGAVSGAFVLPRLRRALAFDVIVSLATVLYGLALISLANFHQMALVFGSAFLAGLAWLNLLANFNTAAQTVLPRWVRARGMSVYLLVFFAGMTAGSIMWGAVAHRIGLTMTMTVAGACAMTTALSRKRFPLQSAEGLNLAPSRHWPAPAIASPVEHDAGPVLISVEYPVAAEHVPEFERAMRELRRLRLRDGAYYWDLFVDSADPTRYVEVFLVDSWVEHLRQHERVTAEDRQIENRISAFLRPGERQNTSHLLAARGLSAPLAAQSRKLENDSA